MCDELTSINLTILQPPYLTDFPLFLTLKLSLPASPTAAPVSPATANPTGTLRQEVMIAV